MKMTEPKIKRDNVLQLVKLANSIKHPKIRRAVLAKLANITSEGMDKSAAIPAFLAAAWPWIAGLLTAGSAGYMGYEAYKGGQQREKAEANEKRREAIFRDMVQRQSQQRHRPSSYAQQRPRIFLAKPRVPAEEQEKPKYTPYSPAESRRRAAERVAEQRKNIKPVKKSLPGAPTTKEAGLSAVKNFIRYMGKSPRDKFREGVHLKVMNDRPRFVQALKDIGVKPATFTIGGKTYEDPPPEASLTYSNPPEMGEIRKNLTRYYADKRKKNMSKQQSADAGIDKEAGALGGLLKLLGYGVKYGGSKIGNLLTRASPRIAYWAAHPSTSRSVASWLGRGAGTIGDAVGTLGLYDLIGTGMGAMSGGGDQEGEYYPQYDYAGGYSPQDMQRVMASLPPQVQSWAQGGGLSQYQPSYSMQMPEGHDLVELTPENYAEMSQQYHLPENLFGGQPASEGVPGSLSSQNEMMRSMVDAPST